MKQSNKLNESSVELKRTKNKGHSQNPKSTDQFYLQRTLGNESFQNFVNKKNASQYRNMSEIGSRNIIQRMEYGDMDEVPPPHSWVENEQLNVREVPDAERGSVTEAINLVRETVQNPELYGRCHQYFQEQCQNGDENTYRQRFERALIWKVDREGLVAGYGTILNRHIAYTQLGYDLGSRLLASTLVHELMHNCGIQTDEEHHLADVAGLYCIGPSHNMELSVGIPLGGSEEVALLVSYRWLLANIGSSRTQLTVGGELNAVGLSNEISALVSSGRIPTPGEVASINLGLSLRGLESLSTGERTDWGGEGFGGIRGRFEIGPSIGRFRIRERRDSPPGAPTTEFLPGFVIQAGLGAEFYIPMGVNAVPLDINAAYRAVIPLNSEAETIHSLIFSLGLNI